MGDNADILTERMIDEMAERDFKEDPFEQGIWETKDHRFYRIKDMGTSHIMNCMELIKKSNFEWRGRYYELFEKELKRRHKI